VLPASTWQGTRGTRVDSANRKLRLTGKQGCLIVAVFLFAALWGLKTWFIYEECFVNYGARFDNPTIYFPECTLMNALMAPFVSLEGGRVEQLDLD
jgi:hypothetical protein